MRLKILALFALLGAAMILSLLFFQDEALLKSAQTTEPKKLSKPYTPKASSAAVDLSQLVMSVIDVNQDGKPDKDVARLDLFPQLWMNIKDDPEKIKLVAQLFGAANTMAKATFVEHILGVALSVDKQAKPGLNFQNILQIIKPWIVHPEDEHMIVLLAQMPVAQQHFDELCAVLPELPPKAVNSFYMELASKWPSRNLEAGIEWLKSTKGMPFANNVAYLGEARDQMTLFESACLTFLSNLRGNRQFESEILQQLTSEAALNHAVELVEQNRLMEISSK